MDSAERSVGFSVEGRGEVDLRKLLVDAVSSTVTALGLLFDGVPGFDLRAEYVAASSSLGGSRSALLEPDEGGRLLSPRSLIIDPPLPNLRLSSSAAFCKSDFLRSVFRAGVLTGFGDLSLLTSTGGTGSVVKGGLGGAAPALTGGSRTVSSSLLLSRSVGSGV